MPDSTAPSMRLDPPPRLGSRDGASPSKRKEAPHVVCAQVGRHFHFHRQLNPPPLMTPVFVYARAVYRYLRRGGALKIARVVPRG